MTMIVPLGFAILQAVAAFALVYFAARLAIRHERKSSH